MWGKPLSLTLTEGTSVSALKGSESDDSWSGFEICFFFWGPDVKAHGDIGP